MNDAKTKDIDSLLSSAKISDYDKLLKKELSEDTPTLSAYFEEYMISHNLKREDVINNSFLPQSYAYQILNGTKANPTRDRVIALCLSMHMNLEDANRALKISGNGILYSKNQRDALIIIALNTDIHDIMKLNEELDKHGMKCLETSKDMKK